MVWGTIGLCGQAALETQMEDISANAELSSKFWGFLVVVLGHLRKMSGRVDFTEPSLAEVDRERWDGDPIL